MHPPVSPTSGPRVVLPDSCDLARLEAEAHDPRWSRPAIATVVVALAGSVGGALCGRAVHPWLVPVGLTLGLWPAVPLALASLIHLRRAHSAHLKGRRAVGMIAMLSLLAIPVAYALFLLALLAMVGGF